MDFFSAENVTIPFRNLARVGSRDLDYLRKCDTLGGRPSAALFFSDLIIRFPSPFSSISQILTPRLASSLARKSFSAHELLLPGMASCLRSPSAAGIARRLFHSFHCDIIYSSQLNDIRRAKLHFAAKLHFLYDLIAAIVLV